jgi:hypothetical protein
MAAKILSRREKTVMIKIPLSVNALANNTMTSGEGFWETP